MESRLERAEGGHLLLPRAGARSRYLHGRPDLSKTEPIVAQSVVCEYRIMSTLSSTYLQLAHSGLAEVFWSRVNTESDQKASIHAFFTDASFAFLGPEGALFFQLTGLALSLGLSPRFQGGVALCTVSPSSSDVQEGQVVSAPPAASRAVYAASSSLV